MIDTHDMSERYAAMSAASRIAPRVSDDICALCDEIDALRKTIRRIYEDVRCVESSKHTLEVSLNSALSRCQSVVDEEPKTEVAP